MNDLLKKSSIIFYSIVFALIVFLNVAPGHSSAAGTSYYIDSVSGSDSNNGTSASTPWKTATNVNSTTFQPGDKILFKAGSVWNSSRFAPLGSGTSTNPITIDMYGTGSIPLLNGNGVINEVIYLNNQQYWTIQNLEITNNASIDAGNRRGIFVSGTNAGTLNGIHINNMNIHDIKGVPWGNQKGRGDQYTCGGIMIWAYNGASATVFNDVKITNTIFSHSTGMAINMQSDYAAQSIYDNSRKATNVVIDNVVTHDIGASGIIIGDTNGLLVQHVATFDSGYYTDDYNVNPMVPNFEFRSYNTTYQYNESARQIGTQDGQAWDVDWGNSGTHLYQYNYSHDNPGGVFMWCDPNENGTHSNLIFRYNISQNDNNSRFRFVCGTGSAQANIYNNTFYNGNPNEHVNIQDDDGLVNATFNNNIWVASGTPVFPTRFTYDYNLYYGFTGPSSDTHKVTGNPQLISPGAGIDGMASAVYYKLNSNSPAINAGKTISSNGGKDFFGNTLYSGAADIGAHEYSGETLPSATTAPTIVDDNTTGTGTNQFNYTGTWSYNNSGIQYNYNGTEHWSNTTNAYVQVAFSGTQIELYGIKDTNEGIAAISIDGGTETNVDFYQATRQNQALIYRSPVLASGSHTLKVRVTGTHSANATNNILSVDKVVTFPNVLTDPTTVNDFTNDFEYVGTWAYNTSGVSANYYGDEHWSNTTNAYVNVRFYGTKIALYGIKDTNEGYAAISIDGGPETNYDFYASTRQYQTLVYTSPALPLGQHTLKVRVTGTHSGSSTNNVLSLDKVVAYANTTVNENTTGTANNQFEYVSTWAYNTSGVSANYSGDEHWSNTTNAYVNVRFYGTQIALYGIKDTNEGYAAISIDGGPETNYDFYASSRQYQSLVYTSPTLPLGQHTMKVRVTGTHSGSSTNNVLSLDKVIVN